MEEVLWGPISPADARAAGAPFASSSILLRPGIDPELRTRVLAEVPLDVIPSGDDTVASFVARLSSSSFLEDSHVQKSRGWPCEYDEWILERSWRLDTRRKNDEIDVVP